MGEKVVLKDIDSVSWEHPADRAALNTLKEVPGLDALCRALVGNTTERSLRLLYLSSSVRVTDKQFPRLHKLLLECCKILDVKDIPEMYVTQNPMLNAGAVGVDKPFITLNSAIVKSTDDAEILAIIAHEMGHILSGHMLYKTLLWIIVNLSKYAIGQMPVAQIVFMGVLIALREWDQKSELSADRAELLVVQDSSVSYNVLMKLAGGNFVDEMSIDEFFNQAKEYEEGGDYLDSLFKFLNSLGKTHPFCVLRLKELKSWKDSGDYQKIIEGDYTKNKGKKKPDFFKDFKSASDSYKKDFDDSKDPLVKEFQKISKSFEEGGKKIQQQAEDFFKNIFSSKE